MIVTSQEHLEGISSNLAQTSTWTQRETHQHLVVKGHCGLTKLVFGQKPRIHANFHQISHKQNEGRNDEVMAFYSQKVKGQLWHHNVLWLLFNIVTREQKGKLWSCFTFGQILNRRHWSWPHWMRLYRSAVLRGQTCAWSVHPLESVAPTSKLEALQSSTNSLAVLILNFRWLFVAPCDQALRQLLYMLYCNWKDMQQVACEHATSVVQGRIQTNTN